MIKEVRYLEILEQAFKTTWRNKFLWVFGLFIFLGSLASNMNWQRNSLPENDTRIIALGEFAQKNPLVFLGIIAIIFAIAIVFFLLKIIGIAAIIKSTNNIAVYRQSKIKTIFSEAKKYLWSMALLELILGVTLGAIMILLIVPVTYLYFIKADVLGTISLIIAVAIGIPLAIIAYFLRRYSYFYMVLGDMKIKIALETAYLLLKKNIRTSLGMSLIVILTGLIMLIATFVSIVLLVIILSIVAYLTFSKIGAMIVLAIGATLTIFGLLVLFSWYETFVQTVWVIFFQNISFEKQPEKKPVAELETTEKLPTPEAV